MSGASDGAESNAMARREADRLRFTLDCLRVTDGDHAAVASAYACVLSALEFIYSVDGLSHANAALEMFRAELAKKHSIIEAMASETRQ